jgi:rubrerythrin
MDDVNLFLVHAIQLEHDAARRFEDLAHAMRTVGNQDVENLFRRLGEFSRKHLASVMARGGYHELPKLAPSEYKWPEGVSPEAVSWEGVDDSLDVAGALDVALAGERGGYNYYRAVADGTRDPEVRRLAREFASEEAEHVAELERWISRSTAV